MSGDNAVDTVQQFVANYEKKLRNLIKRKGKLDAYRDRLYKGEGLNDEQRKAVEGYECVVQNIVFVQDFIQNSKELVDGVEESMNLREKLVEQEHEKYTLNFLHIQSTILRLLNSLDSPIVRTSVMRSSSENHLKLLDITRNMVTAPLLDDWPGSSSTALGNACEFIEKHVSLNLAASNSFNLVVGKNLPVPLPEGSGCSLKKHSFKEVRALCFRLLATPMVQRSLGIPSRSASVSSPLDENIKGHTNEQISEINNGDYILVSNGVKTEIVDSNLEQPSPVDSAQQDEQQCVPKHSDHSMKPLAPTFNFLQASKVIHVEPEVPLASAVGLVKTNPIVPASEVNKPDPETHSPHVYAEHTCQGIHQPVDVHFSQNYNPDVNPENDAIVTQPSVDVHDIHPGDNVQTAIETHQFSENDDHIYCENVTPTSPGKISYADLLRRPNTARAAPSTSTDHADVMTRRDQSTGNVTVSTSVTFEPAEQHHATHFDQQPSRSGFSRGGRNRGFSGAGRGSGHLYPGSTGGTYRGGRGGSMRGGRGQTARDMRAGMAQPTY